MFCSVRHTEFGSYVSLAMSVRQNSNWTVLFGSSYRVRCRMYRWQCQFARTVTGPFCSVRHTEFSSYVSLAMSVRQKSNWTVLFGSSYRVQFVCIVGNVSSPEQ